jgi:hypothetical protein
MSDTRTRLETAKAHAPVVRADPDRIYARRTRRTRRNRVVTTFVAIVIGAVPIAIGLSLARSSGSGVAEGEVLAPPPANLDLAPGEYYYLRVDVVGEIVFDTWWATDASGRIAKVSGGSEYGLDAGTFGPGEFSSDSGPVKYLSTDPVELEQQLRERVQPDGASPEPYGGFSEGPIESALTVSITELLDAPDVTPAQKAALVRVLANLDGVGVDLHAQDPPGRPAILLTTESGGATHRWWVDPQSYQLLAVDNGGGVAEIVQAAGVTSSTDITDLDRSFVPSSG